MGKDQEEVITPEIKQKRDEKITKYKQMVKEIKQDNSITFMMRFMVGPNVGTNEECRNEIHKELAKEEMKKQDISSNN
jgi:Trp operon repressor